METTIHRRITVGVVLFFALRPSGLQFRMDEQPWTDIGGIMHASLAVFNVDERLHRGRGMCTTACFIKWTQAAVQQHLQRSPLPPARLTVHDWGPHKCSSFHQKSSNHVTFTPQNQNISVKHSAKSWITGALDAYLAACISADST